MVLTMLIHWVVKFQNANVDAGNYQICDVHTNDGATTLSPDRLAQIIAYFATTNVAAVNTSIVGVSARFNGAAGYTPLPFPTTEYAAVVAAATGDSVAVNPMATGYASNIGLTGSVLAPLGTSISVSERTATAGPTGRGRHFLPFIRSSAATAGGSVVAADGTEIELLYNYFLRGILGGVPFAASPPVADLFPVVTNSAGTPVHGITSVKAQPIFSNLESRRR